MTQQLNNNNRKSLFTVLRQSLLYKKVSPFYTYTFVFLNILFHYGLSQETGYSSLCYTVGSYRLFIPYVIVCIQQPQIKNKILNRNLNRNQPVVGEGNLKCSIRKQRARREEEPAWDILSDLANRRRRGFHRNQLKGAEGRSSHAEGSGQYCSLLPS